MGRVLNRKEKIILLVISILFLASLSFVINSFYISNTEIMPAQGGKYTEGIVGRPGRINPVYADSSDVNRDLVEILFSGLMEYDQEGRIVKDLAENFEIKDLNMVRVNGYGVYLQIIDFNNNYYCNNRLNSH